MSITAFDVILAPFPYTDKPKIKWRPALVLTNESFNSSHNHLILAMITTAKHSSWESDARLHDYKKAKLPCPSIVRMKIFTIEMGFMGRYIGRITTSDQERVRAAVGKIILPQSSIID